MGEFFLSWNCQQILFCFWKIGSKFPETWILTSIFHKAKMSHRLSVKNKETKWDPFFREIDCISRMVPTTWVADYTHSHFVGPLQVSTHFILGQNFFSVIGQTYTCKCTWKRHTVNSWVAWYADILTSTCMWKSNIFMFIMHCKILFMIIIIGKST